MVLTIEQDSRINFQITVNKKWLVMIMNRLMQELLSICMIDAMKQGATTVGEGGMQGARATAPPPPLPPHTFGHDS